MGYNNGGNFQRKPARKTAMSARKMKLFAECPTESGRGKMSTLEVEINEKCDEIILRVWTNDPEDQGKENDYGKIEGRLSPLDMFAVFKCIERAIDFEPGKREVSIKFKRYTFNNGKRSDKQVVYAQAFIGKDNDGCVYLSLVSYKEKRPKIKFIFKPGFEVEFVNNTGDEVSVAEVSRHYAHAWIDMLRQLIVHVVGKEWKEPEKTDNKGGGYNNNNNNQQRESSGSSNNNNGMFDGDIPF